MDPLRAYELHTGRTCPPEDRAAVLLYTQEGMAALETLRYDDNPRNMPPNLRTFQADMDEAHTRELLSKALDPARLERLFADDTESQDGR